jgi:xanthine/CO dehydrogenase XdhC/CoxF family maturation factor
MIGSPSKVRAIFRALLGEGVAPEQLALVHAPIGLDLGAATPDEIALSIAAELLCWRRGASGGSLRDTAGILAGLLAEHAERHASQAAPTSTSVSSDSTATTTTTGVRP